MPFYSYKAIDNKGAITKGIAVGKHIDDAYNNILTSGRYVLDINQSSKLNDFFYDKFKVGKIERKDIIEFASNLSVMLQAGIPLMTSLMDIADATDNKYFMERVVEIKKSVELGASFSEALSRHEDVFPDMFLKLISAGEVTGKVGESLSDIARHLTRMEEMRSLIMRSLLYPVFALVVTSGALLFWLIYVMPKLKELFVTLGVELPPLTKGLILAGDLAALYWYYLIIIPAILYIVLQLVIRNEAARLYIDGVKLKLPIIGPLTHNKLLALFAEQLRILVSAGITIDRSFDILIDIMPNAVFKKALRNIKEEILLGSTISAALRVHNDLFPALTVRIISVGESIGKLPEQLDYLAKNFIAKLEDMSDKVGKMVEPIIILLIGGLFVLIILGLLAPIFDLISTV